MASAVLSPDLEKNPLNSFVFSMSPKDEISHIKKVLANSVGTVDLC